MYKYLTFFSIFRLFPVGKNRQKNNLKACVFVNSALKIHCHIGKNTLLHMGYITHIENVKHPEGLLETSMDGC